MANVEWGIDALRKFEAVSRASDYHYGVETTLIKSRNTGDSAGVKTSLSERSVLDEEAKLQQSDWDVLELSPNARSLMRAMSQ